MQRGWSFSGNWKSHLSTPQSGGKTTVTLEGKKSMLTTPRSQLPFWGAPVWILSFPLPLLLHLTPNPGIFRILEVVFWEAGLLVLNPGQCWAKQAVHHPIRLVLSGLMVLPGHITLILNSRTFLGSRLQAGSNSCL